jgi:hypothetical protein
LGLFFARGRSAALVGTLANLLADSRKTPDIADSVANRAQ